MEYRTKSTVGAGITKDYRLDLATRLIEYQPGNGTRYVLLFTRVDSPAGAREMLSLPSGGWIITWMNRAESKCLLHEHGGYLHWTYVSQYFGTSKSDAVVLAEVIGYVTGVRATTLVEVFRAEEEEEERQRRALSKN